MGNKEQINREKNRQPMLRTICEARTDKDLEEILQNDKEYQKEKAETDILIDRIEKLGLKPRQWETVDKALSACNDRGSEYGRAAYCLGFQDAVRLGVELFAEIWAVN